jgi:hypothetical protein
MPLIRLSRYPILRTVIPMRRLVLLAVVGLIASCTNQLAVRQAQLSQLVGRSETDLVEALGVPSRTYETGGMKFLSYEDRRVEYVPGSPFYPGFYGPGFYGGGFYGPGFPPEVINLSCDTTFTLAGGVVRSFALRGNACG